MPYVRNPATDEVRNVSYSEMRQLQRYGWEHYRTSFKQYLSKRTVRKLREDRIKRVVNHHSNQS